MRVANTKGSVWYGMHMYSGLAEYREPNSDAYRIFLNEDTIRGMDPSFAGRPVFVHHVDGVDSDLDVLRSEADGWVLESFYNAADGKHWVKFIVVSERAEKAIRQGMRLSNCYLPKAFGAGGQWNGIAYQKEVTEGEYEHLAIVPNPRYEESVILSPDEYKAYNENKTLELKRLANNYPTGDLRMKLQFFKRAKVENAIDPDMSVVLPKSGKEVTITQLVNDMDEYEIKRKSQKANGEDMVDCFGNEMTVNALLEKHKAVCDELESMKSKKVDEVSEEGGEPGDDGDEMPNAEDPAEDEGAKKKALQLAEHEEEEIVEAKAKDEDRKANAKEKAERLRTANSRAFEEVVRVDLSEDQVARGKSRYGS